MRTAHVLAAAAALTAACTANGQPIEDWCSCWITESGNMTSSTGTGYGGGQFFYYDNTGWWNQWFYDSPPASNGSNLPTATTPS